MKGKHSVLQEEIDIFRGYMGTREAAEILGIGMARVRQLLLAGRLPGVKIGNTWIISEEAVFKFKEKHDSKPGPKKPGK
jgi:excisionase family DNA binding protein